MRLTDNQGLVYRTVRDEEISAGESYEEASRIAYDYMRDEALPDWRQFWTDWNAPPSPLMQLVDTLAIMEAVVRNPDFLSRFTKETADNIRKITDMVLK